MDAATTRNRAPGEDMPQAFQRCSRDGSGPRVVGLPLRERVGVGPWVELWHCESEDGEPRLAHILVSDAPDVVRDEFMTAARRLVRRTAEGHANGTLRAHALDERAAVLVTERWTAGSLYDVPLLGWSQDRRLELVKALCRRVASVHAQGDVCGVLPPGAVWLDDELRPVLAPLGAASTAPGQPIESHDGDGLYFAPELQQAEQATPRSDVYALGRLLHFVLAGREPTAEIALVPELSDLRDVPCSLRAIVRKCTTSFPELRYADASELLGDLERWDLGEKVGMSMPSGCDPAQSTNGRGGRSSLAPRARRDSLRELTLDELGAPSESRPSRPTLGAVAARALDRLDSPPERAAVRARRIGLAAAGAVTALAAAAVAWLGGASGAGLPISSVALGIGAGALVAALPHAHRRDGLVRSALGLAVATLVLLTGAASAIAQGSDAHFLHSGRCAQDSGRVAAILSTGQRNLDGAELASCDLEGIDLSAASAIGANLADARLRKAVLGGAVLDGSRLGGADLREADLAGSDLRRADLTGSDLRGADLSDALIEGGTLTDARCDDATLLPAELACGSDGRIAPAPATHVGSPPGATIADRR